MNQQKTIHIAIFGSGTGTNAQKIIDYFRNNTIVQVNLIVCNKPVAGILDIAEREKIPSLVIEKEKFYKEPAYLKELRFHQIDFIVLAGFLWKIPHCLIEAYEGKIINIHPALLPKYGGKGMYGHYVHEAVIANGEKESGITIHYVNEGYDEGQQIFQMACPVLPNDTAEKLAQRIQILEHEYYPKIIEECIKVKTKMMNDE